MMSMEEHDKTHFMSLFMVFWLLYFSILPQGERLNFPVLRVSETEK